MIRPRRTTLAELDLLDIWLQRAEYSIASADALIDRIVAKAEKTAEFPDSGTARPEFGDGVRSVPEGHYLILYRRAAESIEVLRVFDGRRDPGEIIAQMTGLTTR